jgi:hypothetical protein
MTAHVIIRRYNLLVLKMLYRHDLTYSSQTLFKLIALIILILQMKKMKLLEVKEITHGKTTKR